MLGKAAKKLRENFYRLLLLKITLNFRTTFTIAVASYFLPIVFIK